MIISRSESPADCRRPRRHASVESVELREQRLLAAIAIDDLLCVQHRRPPRIARRFERRLAGQPERLAAGQRVDGAAQADLHGRVEAAVVVVRTAVPRRNVRVDQRVNFEATIQMHAHEELLCSSRQIARTNATDRYHRYAARRVGVKRKRCVRMTAQRSKRAEGGTSDLGRDARSDELIIRASWPMSILFSTGALQGFDP
ncbi:hypothetical protein BVI2075_640134 [Burkholderia vietnamiensis]|nr:hypothetical protein BVI1335_1010084 [Burkholderia vietnamiensis]CAG9217614.1 hypothetical protein BVI2075_640134 [Burkholderia vietnamiensis]